MMAPEQYEVFKYELNVAKTKRKRGRPSKKQKMLEQNAIAPPVGKVSINLGNLDAWLGKEQEYVKPRE